MLSITRSFGNSGMKKMCFILFDLQTLITICNTSDNCSHYEAAAVLAIDTPCSMPNPGESIVPCVRQILARREVQESDGVFLKNRGKD